MQGIFQSIIPIWDKYKIEIILIISALFIAFISVFIFLINQSTLNEDNTIVEPIKSESLSVGKILVDMSGAVEKTDVFEISSGARLKDVLALAGGLSADADRKFFARNFNLARILKDQEKIYIPNTEETQKGEAETNQQVFQNVDSNTLDLSDKININSASMSELDALPGVGKVTAQKIIQNRPYISIEELLDKKVVNKSVFEKIKNQIER